MKKCKVEKRCAKKSDQTNVEKAYQILLEAMEAHPEIEQTLWASACWSALVNGYLSSEIPYSEFLKDWESARAHYEKWWDK